MNTFSGKILVIRGGAIGDFILTLPALAALRHQFPQARLDLLGYPHIIQLALAGRLVDCIHSIEARSLAGFFARDGQLSADLADFFSEFDLIVSYLYDPDEIFRANLGRCTFAQFIGGPHRPEAASSQHATKVYLKPLERLAIFEADPVPRLTINLSTVEFTDSAQRAELYGTRPSRSQLALHPGSGSERKNWPEANWAQLVQHLIQNTNFDLLLVGGEAEGQRLQRLAAALPPDRARVAQSLPLVQLAGLLERTAGFIGHDSGISHLAAALGLPGLLLWADTAEEVWAPQSDKMIVLRHAAGLQKLPVKVVLEQVSRLRASVRQ